MLLQPLKRLTRPGVTPIGEQLTCCRMLYLQLPSFSNFGSSCSQDFGHSSNVVPFALVYPFSDRGLWDLEMGEEQQLHASCHIQRQPRRPRAHYELSVGCSRGMLHRDVVSNRYDMERESLKSVRRGTWPKLTPSPPRLLQQPGIIGELYGAHWLCRQRRRRNSRLWRFKTFG